MSMNPIANSNNEPTRDRFGTKSIELDLKRLLLTLPPESLLPVWWLREELAESSTARQSTSVMTATEFAAAQPKPRGAEWARRMARAGRVNGAYKIGGDWMFPDTAVVQESVRLAQPRRTHFIKEKINSAA